MTLDAQQASQFLQRTLQRSGSIIGDYFLRPDRIGLESKSDSTPVTAADRAVELYLREEIERAFPQHGIIGEEYGNVRPEAEFVWVLDPIDGTNSFIHGVPLFTTLVGILRRGAPFFGAIHQPTLNLLCLGDGERATLNGTAIRVRQCRDVSEASVLASAWDNTGDRWSKSGFEALVSKAKLFRTWGDGYGYMLVAAGMADVMLDPTMKIWDMAAIVPVLKGAGGVVTAWDGGDPLASCSMVATGGAIHESVLQILSCAGAK